MILSTIVNDPEIQIVVEVMGGIEPAYTFVKRMSSCREECGDLEQGAGGKTRGGASCPSRKREEYQLFCLRQA